MVIYPEYYSLFKCIADKCKHNCCIGWEIDIDDDTYNFYINTKGDFGRRLRENINNTDVPCFKLGEGERCPFLNNNGLCDIITEMGEEGLCQICSDHPRFRNYFEEFTEVGLGMCCEEAARIILSQTDSFRLVCSEEGGFNITKQEETFLNLRAELIKMAENQSISLKQRVEEIAKKIGIILPNKSPMQWALVYYSLERLDPKRDYYINLVREADFEKRTDLSSLNKPAEKLLTYLIYRHLADGFAENNIEKKLKFICLFFNFIMLVVRAFAEKNGSITLSDFTEICRLFSSEIEYSDENIKIIMDLKL